MLLSSHNLLRMGLDCCNTLIIHLTSAFLCSFLSSVFLIEQDGYRFESWRTPHGAQKLHEGRQDRKSVQSSVDQVVQVPFSPNGLEILRDCLEEAAHEQG